MGAVGFRLIPPSHPVPYLLYQGGVRWKDGLYFCTHPCRYLPSVFGQERAYPASQVANALLVPDWVPLEGDSGVDDPPGILQYLGDRTLLPLWDLIQCPTEGDEEGVLP